MFSTKGKLAGTTGVLVLLAAAGLAGCGGGKESPRKAEPLPAVKAATVKLAEETVPEIYEATGTVRARVSSVLSARVMGYLREVRVQAGDTVQPGQVIAVIEAREIDSGLKQAEAVREEARNALPEVENAIAAARAQLELAEATHRRMKSLYEQKSITQQEFDEAEARLRMARANHEMAAAKKAQLEQKIRQAESAVAQAAAMKSYTEITAPFRGIVVERKAEPGMLAAPGMPIAVVEREGGYRLEAAVEENRLGRIRPGMSVEVILDAVGTPQQGRVEEIVPALDPGSRSFMVKIGVAGGLLRSGMFGRARFTMGEKKALLVPAAAVVKKGQVEQVYVVENGVARARLVTTGAAHGERLEVLTGLRAGDTVAAPVPAELRDGSPVEVRP
ncbi:MAG: RND transporter [Bryobacteraceae bacterium]|nr:MAG: RND transporter [Bryobacteraceae bacterium]